jgi:hypothetical protein
MWSFKVLRNYVLIVVCPIIFCVMKLWRFHKVFKNVGLVCMETWIMYLKVHFWPSHIGVKHEWTIVIHQIFIGSTKPQCISIWNIFNGLEVSMVLAITNYPRGVRKMWAPKFCLIDLRTLFWECPPPMGLTHFKEHGEQHFREEEAKQKGLTN